MADTAEGNSQEQKDDKNKKNILEEKSKEELIKLVKKYLGLLQKSKNKTDILNEKYSTLEQEKNSLIEEYQSKEREFQKTIENLQNTISKYEEQKVPFSENILEDEQFKQKLKDSEDKIRSLLLQENEEQLQCLNLQLQTLKASCQCIQEENLKLRKSYNEKLEEVSVLADKNAGLACDFNKKAEEYELLFSIKENTQAKYEKSIEENHSLKNEIKKLMFENNNFQKSNKELVSEIQELKKCAKDSNERDLVILMSDLQKCQEENEKLKKEMQDSNSNNVGILLSDLQKYQDEIEELKEKIRTQDKSKSSMIVEHELDDNLNSKKAFSELGNETYDSLVQKNKLLEEENKNLLSELNNCRQQIHELQNEIESIVKVYQIDDYKIGIELALLHGASSDKIICPVEPVDSKNKFPQFQNLEIKENVNETLKTEHYPFVETSGLEYALLQGGDPTNFAANTDVTSDMYSMFVPCHKTIPIEPSMPEPLVDNTSISFEELIEKCERYEAEKKTLQKNLDEYSSLCHDTMKENNELKEELEDLRARVTKIVHDQQTNTEHSFSEYSEETCSSDILNNKALASEGGVKCCENCNKLRSEIMGFYESIQSKTELDSEQEKSNIDHLLPHEEIKKMFDEVFADLQRKKSELNEYNLQLELLVIGIKQGVRQKNSIYQAQNNPSENINALKLLIEDLVSRSNNLDSKLQMLHSETNSKIQEMQDQINQLKELNQFLEDENSELSIEVEKLKSTLNDSIKNSTNYTQDTYLQNTELYSIDESCEFDNRTDANSNIQLDKRNLNICDISVQVCPVIKDSAIQFETDIYTEKEVITTKDTDIQTNFEEENCKIVEELKNDNESLRKLADEKSNLVESIHCQMDSLLIKVEELTTELQDKEDDLKQIKLLNADLEKMLSEAKSNRNHQMSDLKVIQDIVLDCKRKNILLNNDVKSFTSVFEEMVNNVKTDILNSIDENCSDVKSATELYNHKENNLTIIKNWIFELAAEFERWLNYINKMTLESSLNLSEIVDSVENVSSHVSNISEMCHEDACCPIFENIRNLNACKLKFCSAFCDHLNNYNSLVKEIHNYKVDVIPKLEQRLSECCCKKASKVQTEAENVQERISEESLKNTLAETEMKMNKFKLIAVKLKKDLTSTKEQLNNVICDKEKLQKKNADILNELNKLTEEQCKYVQNYQTLQNEFDKLQDECEIHKGNMKKLEEDLALKHQELTSVKEQVVDLEKQLKSSKNLLETNLSVKKDLESKCAELESQIIILESKINEKEQKISSMDTEISKHLKELNIVQEDNKALKNQLELAQKEGNKKSLLDLEMADYERSITELNNKIKKKEDEIEDCQNEIQMLKEKNECLHEELKTTESLKETEAKRAESLREILEKTKSELNEVKEHEAELLSKTASLEVRLESMTQQEEHLKIQLSEASVQIQHFQDVIKTSSDNHQRIVRSLEQKISNQKEEILVAHRDVESVKQEFENYKVRVHSVLKHQKSVTPAIASADSDLKEKLETVNEKLKLQVKELSEKISALSLEYDTLQEEYNSLSQRYDKLIEDRDKKDKEWNHRLELINLEKNRLRAAQEELSSQHLLQNEMLVATYKKQIKIMSEEHKKIVNDLQKQLDAADVEISRLQRDQQKLQGLPITPSPQDSATSFDLLSQERQEGEGSENTDEINTPIKHLSLATIPTSGFLSFEKLLQSPVEPGTPASFVSAYDAEKLALDLNTANKKIDHLSELLNDSESTNLRLSEQVRVLKDEVRRLENNKERQQHAENLEYLKNIFIKFATLQPGSERAMLIPVLTTMLKLNSNEQQQLKSVAGDVQSDDNMNSGWGSYLHRWSGLS